MSGGVIIQRALISVSDKKGLVSFAKGLRRFGVEILSTGGTLKVLKTTKIPVIPVEDFTGSPEILEGRVKTLHPKIHGGLLYRRDKKSHVREAQRHQIRPIDLVVVNLYPFEEVTARKNVNFQNAIENIDIGGPSMLRSAAKNFESVTVICDPADYSLVLNEMKANDGFVSDSLRRYLARKVFERTSSYDSAIKNFLIRSDEKEEKTQETSLLPDQLDFTFKKVQDLRYGENPHQRAGFYRNKEELGAGFKQLHGKELSFNNLLDVDAVLGILAEFDKPAACVVKHNNPCGVAEGSDLEDTLGRAIECDSMSAFGGIIGVNRPCDKAMAQKALGMLKFFEVFIAPSFDAASQKLLKERKNLRLITVDALEKGDPCDVRFLRSGLLLQDRDHPVRVNLQALKKNLRFVTKAKLKESEVEDLLFAWKCVKVVKSNAIVITQGRQTVGIGAGQMSRVDAVHMACLKAGYRTEGGILASDAFFPMPDSIEEAKSHKIRVIIQPGGSIRDGDVVAACDQHGIVMAFTGKRHFRH